MMLSDDDEGYVEKAQAPAGIESIPQPQLKRATLTGALETDGRRSSDGTIERKQRNPAAPGPTQRRWQGRALRLAGT